MIFANRPDRGNIHLPVAVIKINHNKIGRFVRQHWINAEHIPTKRVLAAQVSENCIIGQWCKPAMFAFETFGFLHIADAGFPLVLANRRISVLSILRILIAKCIHILTAAKQ